MNLLVKIAAIFSGLLLVLALNGCGTITGYEVKPDSVRFIRAGETTRAEITENLGPPTEILSGNGDVLVYEWDDGWTKVHTEHVPKTPGERGYYRHRFRRRTHTEDVITKRSAFCVALDETDRVVETTFLQRLKPEAFEIELAKWQSKIHPFFEIPPTPFKSTQHIGTRHGMTSFFHTSGDPAQCELNGWECRKTISIR
jgi:hypothetical protein